MWKKELSMLFIFDPLATALLCDIGEMRPIGDGSGSENW